MNTSTILALGMPGGWELIVIAVIALLIFGRRLPDVARSVGRSIIEFKKGLRDVHDQIEADPPDEDTKPRALSASREQRNSEQDSPSHEPVRSSRGSGDEGP